MKKGIAQLCDDKSTGKSGRSPTGPKNPGVSKPSGDKEGLKGHNSDPF